ncbi:hypothetical protein OG203_34895 [Nocardia sp. NBC_01499]|uniref:hypothetical protein n=1 Tax=Nocardia sp. NBC_01499 TaxID=2903597 RepID=UPI0038664244
MPQHHREQCFVHNSRSNQLTATTDSGEVLASFSTAPTTVAAGHINLTISQADYYIDATSVVGTPTVTIPSNRYAGNTITVKTQTGGIDIH